MKIAVCIPGFIRTWEHTKLSFLKNLVQDHDCDVFVHTYRQNYFEYSARKQDITYTENDIKSLLSDLNVKKLVIEDREKIKNDIKQESLTYKNVQYYDIKIKESSEEADNYIDLGVRIYDQLRKIHLSNKLRKDYQKENNVTYDYVVKTRFDVLFIDKIDWNSFVDNQIVYNGIGGCGGFPDDLVGIGKEDPMNAYMDRFEALDRLCFQNLKKDDIVTKNWYDHFGNSLLPVHGFCAHDTLIRNLLLNGFDISSGGFRNRLLRNEQQILNWEHTVIDGQSIPPSKMTNGVILSGDNSNFNIADFNKNLMS